MGLVLLQDALVVVFPELLGGVLACYSLQDCFWSVSGGRSCVGWEWGGHTLLPACTFVSAASSAHVEWGVQRNAAARSVTWVFILKLGQIVDIFVDDDP